MAAAYQKCRVPINTETWTAIIAPMPCNYFSLKNSDGAAVLLRTDQNDPSSEDTLAANGLEIVNTARNSDYAPGGSSGSVRFPAGSTVCCVKALSGVGPVVVTWVS